MSTTFHFNGAVGWTRLGPFVRVGAGIRSVSIVDPASGLTPAGLTQNGVAVTQVTTNAFGFFSFTTTDVPGVSIDFGLGPFDLYAKEVPALAVASSAPTDAAVAALVGTSSSTQGAMDGRFAPKTGSLSYAAISDVLPSRTLALTAPSTVGTGQWFIKRTGTDYLLMRSVGEGRYLCQELKQVGSLPGGYLVNQLAFTYGAVPMLSQDDNTATYSGTWTHTFLAANTTYKQLNFTGGSISSGSSTLTVSDAAFIAGDVGRRVTINGAGASGANLDLTITGVTSGTVVTLGGSASTTVSGASVTLWSGYRYSTSAGATATWTSPAATSLGVRIVTAANGGLFKVSVDGSTTRADALPTAQDKVTDGSYPNTILVANGGTLNPTDRVLDTYSSGTLWDVPTAVASGLASTTHTLVLTATGYTRTGASGNRSYLTGFSYAVGTETPLTANTDMCQTKSLHNAFSAFEYAYKFKTTGSTSDFIGNVHGYEQQLSLGIVVDGVATTITDGTTVAVAGSAVITRVTECYHMDTPSTVTFRVNTTYTIDRRGLTVRHVDRWAVAATVANAYPAMLPQSGYIFDSGQIDAAPTTYTMTAGDGSRKGQLSGTTVALWDADGQWVTSITVPGARAVTNNYASDYKVYIEDRAPSGSTKLSKVYFTRTGRTAGTTEAVAAGDVWAAEATYSWAYLPEGAAKSFV